MKILICSIVLILSTASFAQSEPEISIDELFALMSAEATIAAEQSKAELEQSKVEREQAEVEREQAEVEREQAEVEREQAEAEGRRLRREQQAIAESLSNELEAK